MKNYSKLLSIETQYFSISQQPLLVVNRLSGVLECGRLSQGHSCVQKGSVQFWVSSYITAEPRRSSNHMSALFLAAGRQTEVLTRRSLFQKTITESRGSHECEVVNGDLKGHSGASRKQTNSVTKEVQRATRAPDICSEKPLGPR